MTRPAILDKLEGMGCIVTPCGSRITCDPPVLDTDEDWLVHLPQTAARPTDFIADVVVGLATDGFSLEGGEHYQQQVGGTFMSMRKDGLNLIVTGNDEFVRKHHAATALCKRLNLPKKADRVALFQAVLYGNIWTELNV